MNHELEIPPPVSFKKKVKDCVSVIAERKYGVWGGCVGVVRCDDGGVELLYGNARKVLAANGKLTPVGKKVLEVLDGREVKKYPELADFLRVARMLDNTKKPTQLGEKLYRMLKQILKGQHNSPKISTYRNQ